jgi:hypothetical protein
MHGAMYISLSRMIVVCLQGYKSTKGCTVFPMLCCASAAGFQPRYHCKRAMAATQDVVELAKAKGMSPATLAQAWAAGRWAAEAL